MPGGVAGAQPRVAAPYADYLRTTLTPIIKIENVDYDSDTLSDKA